MDQKEKQQQRDDAAVASLSTYKELKRRLEDAARHAMASYNTVRLYEEAGIEIPRETLDEGVTAVLALEQLEETMQGFYDLGYPRCYYERPDMDKPIQRNTSNPWADWQKSANVVQENNQTETGNVPQGRGQIGPGRRRS